MAVRRTERLRWSRCLTGFHRKSSGWKNHSGDCADCRRQRRRQAGQRARRRQGCRQAGRGVVEGEEFDRMSEEKSLYERIGGHDSLAKLLRQFYADVRQHKIIRQIFNERIHDWTAHLTTIENFWARQTRQAIPAMAAAWENICRCQLSQNIFHIGWRCGNLIVANICRRRKRRK